MAQQEAQICAYVKKTSRKKRESLQRRFLRRRDLRAWVSMLGRQGRQQGAGAIMGAAEEAKTLIYVRLCVTHVSKCMCANVCMCECASSSAELAQSSMIVIVRHRPRVQAEKLSRPLRPANPQRTHTLTQLHPQACAEDGMVVSGLVLA